MQHYYNDFSKDLNEARAKQEYINKEILPFSQYLETNINALKKKEIKVKWEEVETDVNATINLDGYLYKYSPTSKIQLDFELLDYIMQK